MTITSETAFTEYLKKVKARQRQLNADDISVENITVTNQSLEGFLIHRMTFIKCIFKNCRFEDFEFNGIEFINSDFKDCIFQNTIIMDCSLASCTLEDSFSNTLLFGMTSLEDVKFIKGEFQFLTFSDCGFQKVEFKETWFLHSKFELGDHFYLYKSQLFFLRAVLQFVTYYGLDLTESKFEGCEMGSSFIDCVLSSKTFINTEKISKNSNRISGIDFFTINKSEELPEDILKSVFGILNKNVKEIISNLTTEPMYYSVFISYSFKDAHIGRKLAELLRKFGVEIFFWEHDAPGGMKLKKIMIDNIRHYEKFLFIASADSLKSAACHYEITEARKKYYESWAEIFVPIHIDNYLFTVRKEDIPSKLSENFWENIEELKEFHSLDFTFIKNNLKRIELNPLFQKLLNTLKIKKDGNTH
jgi:uncharacterized protein YjbI with pentapeptide repeats